MKVIKQTYAIAAPREDVWDALTNPTTIEQWSGASAIFPARVGAPYSLWDGDIVGEILEIEPMQRLVQTWKPTNWAEQDSVVTFTLLPLDTGTRVELLHDHVDASDYGGTDEGWNLYYLGAVKEMLESRTRKAQAVEKRQAASTKRAAVTKKIRGKKRTPSKARTAAKNKSTTKKRATGKRTTGTRQKRR